MSKRRQHFDLPTDDPKIVIEVCVRYSKFDNSYHDPNAERQGYWVNVVPVEIDGAFRTTTAFSGVKSFLADAKRFSEKKLTDLLASVKHEVLVGHVEDRKVQVAIEVANRAGVRITQWDKAKERADNATSFNADDLVDKE